MKWLRRLFGKEPADTPRATHLGPAEGSRFHSGQVWRYKSRPDEQASRAIVGRVEDAGRGGVIVHVQLNNLRVRNPSAPSGHSPLIQHLPVAEAHFESSVIELEAENAPLDGFEQGYQVWREAFDSGRGGVFTVSLAELVDLMESTLMEGRPTSGIWTPPSSPSD